MVMPLVVLAYLKYLWFMSFAIFTPFHMKNVLWANGKLYIGSLLTLLAYLKYFKFFSFFPFRTPNMVIILITRNRL